MTRYSVQGSRSPASTMPTLLCTWTWHEICSNPRSRIICRKGEEVSKKTKILCLFNHQPCWVSAYLSFIKKTCLQARRYLDRSKILILIYIKIYCREFVMIWPWPNESHSKRSSRGAILYVFLKIYTSDWCHHRGQYFEFWDLTGFWDGDGMNENVKWVNLKWNPRFCNFNRESPINLHRLLCKMPNFI